jgi:signal transduction histidine kinase
MRIRTLSQKVATNERLISMGTVVAGMVHEVRNPLNGIINALRPVRQLLEPGQQDVRELVELALGCADRINALAGRILAQGRAGESTWSEVNVAENLAFAVQLLGFKAPEGVKLVSRFDVNQPVLVIGESGALGQVWINLIENAIDAVGQRGEVVVELEREKGRVGVRISDSGPGVPRAVRDRIFEPFFTTKDVGRGTGLGLAIVRQIIERHRGKIDLVSPPSGGATFVVSLPDSESPIENEKEVRTTP